MAVSSVEIMITILFLFFNLDSRGPHFRDILRPSYITIGFLTVLGIFCTISFFYLDKLCSYCYSCFLSAPGQLAVFDPDHPEKNSLIKNGDVEEVIEVEADAADEENIPMVENEERIPLITTY